jgi:hypothetical protein
LTLLLALMLACSGDDNTADTSADTDTDTDTDTDADTDTDTDADTDTGAAGSTAETGSPSSTGHTGITGDTGSALPTVDCLAIPASPVSFNIVPGAKGYHGLVFTDAGTVIGSDNNSLIQSDAAGAWSVFLPGTGSMEQLDRMPDGTIVGIKGGDIVSIAPTGATTVLASVPNAYGIRVGPDEKIYVADWNRITRIDPVLGTVEVWLDPGGQFSPKVLDFSVDLTKMYVGSISQGGNVYVIDLDANFDPLGNPTIFADTPGSWHDGLAVDVCGNLYVAEYTNSAMYRISPSGSVSTLFTAPGGGSRYGHGVVFGNGLGGFSTTAVYIPQPYNGNTVSEVEIGVPYRTYAGPVVNGP